MKLICVLRGGAQLYLTDRGRVGARDRYQAEFRNNYVGFRVCEWRASV